MKVTCIAHTKLSNDFEQELYGAGVMDADIDRRVVALTAIRTCYSALPPSEIAAREGHKYFEDEATDGEGGREADRLFRHITRSGHTSTLEHITYTFAIEGVSRALLAQLTRHRQFSFSVQSQRYVRFGSGDKSGGFSYVMPDSVKDKFSTANGGMTGEDIFESFMLTAQAYYDELRSIGVPPEDARAVLPNAAACNLVMTANLRALLEFYNKRQPGKGAQHEIAVLAESLRLRVIGIDPWVAPYFETK